MGSRRWRRSRVWLDDLPVSHRYCFLVLSGQGHSLSQVHFLCHCLIHVWCQDAFPKIHALMVKMSVDVMNGLCGKEATEVDLEARLPHHLHQFYDFFKGASTGAGVGKSIEKMVVPYLSYSLRVLGLYICDFVDVWMLLPACEMSAAGKQDVDFEASIQFLTLAEAALDIQKCNDNQLAEAQSGIALRQ